MTVLIRKICGNRFGKGCFLSSAIFVPKKTKLGSVYIICSHILSNLFFVHGCCPPVSFFLLKGFLIHARPADLFEIRKKRFFNIFAETPDSGFRRNDVHACESRHPEKFSAKIPEEPKKQIRGCILPQNLLNRFDFSKLLYFCIILK